MWSYFSSSPDWLVQTIIALCVRILKMLHLVGKMCLLFQWRSWSFSDYFLCVTIYVIIVGSKKGMDPLSLGFSMVSCIWRSMELMCWRNRWQYSVCWMSKVSSTQLHQSLGGFVAGLMALDPNSSMNRLAIKGLIGEPMAAPWTCSKYLPWKRK